MFYYKSHSQLCLRLNSTLLTEETKQRKKTVLFTKYYCNDKEKKLQHEGSVTWMLEVLNAQNYNLKTQRKESTWKSYVYTEMNHRNRMTWCGLNSCASEWRLMLPSYKHSSELFCSIRGRELHDNLCNYQLQKDSAQWRCMVTQKINKR